MVSQNNEQYRGMINYTSRDYNSIMNEFWELVPKLTDLWKPESDSDPGVVLGKFLASIADMLSVNLDWLANEIFGPTVSQRKNAERLFGLMGYTLGWYTAARTEITFTNNTVNDITLDFGFNGANFCTLNAYTDITQQPRVITYNILPLTNKYGSQDTRSKRSIVTSDIDVFTDTDIVHIPAGGSITRVGIEGELRQITVAVQKVKDNNYIVKLPSQHLDTTAVWIKSKSSLNASDSEDSIRWLQVGSAAEFVTPEPRFAVTYDNYSNAQIQISNYLNQLENFNDNYLTIYWIECSGVIGSVSSNVLSNFLPAKPDNNPSSFDGITISNLSNTTELPHTHVVTGKSPETAKEAYFNSRNYINTYDSFITLPDFNRFLRREPGVDCGLVIDCQKALEINLAIYNTPSDVLSDTQKSKMYISYRDFPESDVKAFKWEDILGFNPTDPQNFIFGADFKPYVAMCYAIHNDFKDSYDYGSSTTTTATNSSMARGVLFKRYKPPQAFIDGVLADFAPNGVMTTQLQFGYARIFPWFVVGEIYPKNPVSQDVAMNIVETVKEALALYFAPANRNFGQKPTIMEVVDIIEKADSRIKYFDAGSLKNSVITWGEYQSTAGGSRLTTYDIEYFNPISFAQYKDPGAVANNIRIAPEWITK